MWEVEVIAEDSKREFPVLPIAKSVIKQLQLVFLLLYITILPKNAKGCTESTQLKGSRNSSFLFNLSIITSTHPQQEGLLRENNSLVVSFIISFHSQLPSTSPSQVAKSPIASLCSPSISVDGGERRRGKCDGPIHLCTLGWVNGTAKISQ